MDKTNTNGMTGTNNSAVPDLAQYQAQWEKIHNDTIRQIKLAKEQEARNAEMRAKMSSQSSRG